MTIQAVYDGLQTNLSTVSGLTAYAFQPSVAVYPCAFPVLPDIDYHRAMSGGLRQLELEVVLLLQGFEQESRTENLIAHLEPSGTYSVFAAIESDKTLGGAAQDLIVRAFNSFGFDEMAGYSAIGGAYPVTVLLA